MALVCLTTRISLRQITSPGVAKARKNQFSVTP